MWRRGGQVHGVGDSRGALARSALVEGSAEARGTAWYGRQKKMKSSPNGLLPARQDASEGVPRGKECVSR